MNYTQEQRAAALEHVRYEIQALLQTPAHNPKDESIVETIYFRKMAHARALHGFFTTPIANRHKDDVLSEDYGFAAKPIYSDADEERFLDRYNKDLLHISYTRLGRIAATKPWPISDMILPIKSRCLDFIPHVVALSWPSIPREEREKWRVLIPNAEAGIPLQQHTSNVSTQQITVIESHRSDRSF